MYMYPCMRTTMQPRRSKALILKDQRYMYWRRIKKKKQGGNNGGGGGGGGGGEGEGRIARRL